MSLLLREGSQEDYSVAAGADLADESVELDCAALEAASANGRRSR